MIAYNLQKYIEQKHVPKKYSELSFNPRGNNSLITSDKQEAYSFDDIVSNLFPSHSPTSADALLFRRNSTILIEFKSGFTRRITRESYDPEMCKCPTYKVECLDYKDILLKNAELEIQELIQNIQLKVIESRWTLEYHLSKHCDTMETPKAIKYIVVADIVKANPLAALDYMNGNLAKKPSSNNIYNVIKNKLHHYFQESTLHERFAYESVEVLSVEEFTSQYA